MNKFTPFLLLVLLVLVSTTALGVKPTVQETGPLTIEYPKSDFFKLGDDFKLHFHVTNSTGALVPQSDLSCEIQVYNMVNGHLVETNTANDGNGVDVYINLTTDIITELGTYPYVINCNDSGSLEFGELSTSFRITYDGEDDSDQTKPLITAILGMSIFFLGFAFYLDEEHFLLKLLSLFFALISLMLLPKVFFNEYSTITTFLKVPLWFFRIFVTYFGAYLFYHWVQKSEVMAKLWGK